MSAQPFISVERHGAVALVRLDRPPANALDLALATEGDQVLEQLAASDAAALVLTGTGRFFSAGLDVKSVPTYDREQQRQRHGELGGGRPRLGAAPGHPIPRRPSTWSKSLCSSWSPKPPVSSL